MPDRRLSFALMVAFVVGAGCSPVPDDSGGSGGSGGSTGGASATGGRGGTNATGGRGGSSGGSGGSSTGSGGSGGSSSGGTGGSSSGGSGGSGGSSGGSGGSSGGSGGTAGGGETGGSGGSTGGSGGSGSDASAGTGGSGSTTDMGPGNGGPFPPGPHKVVLITGDTANPNDPSRLQMIAILQSMKATHNIDMEEIAANQVRASAMMGKALLIASPNANYFGVTPEAPLKDLAVPIMVSKDGNTRVYGLGTVGNTDANQDSIRIIATDHPITTGFPMGVVKVMTTAASQRMVQFTNVGPGAKKLATIVNNANQFCLIAYDKGSDMGGGFMAPAKRVGFFWHRPAGPTEDGKKLFMAAVEWAIRP